MLTFQAVLTIVNTCALAALAVVSAASAQSSVTFYGVLDAGYSKTENQSSLGNLGLNSSSSGIGSNGLSTSRWGIRGVEDLGGGLKANFQLESELNVGTGVAGSTGNNGASVNSVSPLFNRVATVGLAGNFGEVKLGRDYTPIYSTILASDPFGRVGATTVNLIPAGTRASNMISYSTPTFAGFTVKAMAGENKAEVDAIGATPASNRSNRSAGLNATYASGPLMVAVGWGQLKGASAVDGTIVNGQTAIGSAQGDKQDGSAIVATYDFGVAKLFANYIQSEITTATLGARLKAKETNIGVSIPLGAFTVLGSFGHNDLDANYSSIYGSGAINAKGNDYVLGATYDLSKRTTLYAKTGTYNKVNGTVGTINGDFKTTATAVGVRHSF